MKKLLLATAAVIAVSAPAMADEYVYTQTQDTTVTTTNYSNSSYNGPFASALTGAYVGVLGGYTYTDADYDVAGITGDTKIDGGDYGIFVGYQIDQYLENTIGINGAIEAHFAWSDADGDEAGVDFEKNHEWGVSFRPGISISESINPYGILGYKRAEFEASAAGASDDESFDGFELGIGTELVAYGDFGIRAEYAHTFYGEEDGFDPDEDTIRLGVAYHF